MEPEGGSPELLGSVLDATRNLIINQRFDALMER